MVYGFLLNMFIMKRLDEAYLTTMVTLKRITEVEKQMIMASPQMPIVSEQDSVATYRKSQFNEVTQRAPVGVLFNYAKGSEGVM